MQSNTIPELAFGTWPLKGKQAIDSVNRALELGYRHLDTAQMYENEAEVGQAFVASGLPREEVFITTKINPPNYSKVRFLDSALKSRDALQVDSVDLLLLHWPPLNQPLEPLLDLLDSTVDQKITRSIGISNFTIAQMNLACVHLQNPVRVNQVEFHPFLDQSRLLKAATEKNVRLTAYTSLAKGKVASEPLLIEIANRLGKTPGAVALRWIIQQGVIAAMMSTNPQRMRDNKACLEFELTAEDMAQIHKLTQQKLRLVSPEGLAPQWDE